MKINAFLFYIPLVVGGTCPPIMGDTGLISFEPLGDDEFIARIACFDRPAQDLHIVIDEANSCVNPATERALRAIETTCIEDDIYLRRVRNVFGTVPGTFQIISTESANGRYKMIGKSAMADLRNIPDKEKLYIRLPAFEISHSRARAILNEAGGPFATEFIESVSSFLIRMNRGIPFMRFLTTTDTRKVMKGKGQIVFGENDEVIVWYFNAGTDEACSICLDKFDPEGINLDTVLTDCSHLFHIHCLAKWMRQAKNCPICRDNDILDI